MLRAADAPRSVAGPFVAGEGPVAVGAVGPPIRSPSFVCAAPVGRVRPLAHHRQVLLGALNLPESRTHLLATMLGRGHRGAGLQPRRGHCRPGFDPSAPVRRRRGRRTATDEERGQSATQPKSPNIQDEVLSVTGASATAAQCATRAPSPIDCYCTQGCASNGTAPRPPDVPAATMVREFPCRTRENPERTPAARPVRTPAARVRSCVRT